MQNRLMNFIQSCMLWILTLSLWITPASLKGNQFCGAPEPINCNSYNYQQCCEPCCEPCYVESEFPSYQATSFIAPTSPQVCYVNPCCESGDFLSRDALIIGGTLIVAGIVGAVAVCSWNCHDNHRHHCYDNYQGNNCNWNNNCQPCVNQVCQPTCAEQTPCLPCEKDCVKDNCWTNTPCANDCLNPEAVCCEGEDTNQLLTFDFAFTASADLVGAQIISFVIDPDGCLFEDTVNPIINISAANLTPSQTITISNPKYGNYHLGVQVKNSPTGTLTPSVIVVASRNASTTGITLSGSPSIVVSESQFYGEFAYSCVNSRIP